MRRRGSALKRALRSDGAADGASFAWPEWADGRPRRLKRGKHFTGDPKIVEREAKLAAETLGKLAITSKDSSGEYEYLWIQFVDGEVESGRPCPVCGGTDLLKAQKYFLRCATCASTLKAASGQEVEAGTYPLNVPGSANGRFDGRARVLESGAYAEIVGTRILSPADRETFEPGAADEIVIETSVRFAGPVAEAWLKLWIAVEEAGAVLRLRCPETFDTSGPETVEVAVRIPPALLASREYEVSVGVHYKVDLLQSGTDRLQETSARFRVRDAKLPSLEANRDEPEPPVTFTWTVSSTPDEDLGREVVGAGVASSGALAVGAPAAGLPEDPDEHEGPEDDDDGEDGDERD